MKYYKTKEATFIERPNRFIAKVLIDDRIETVHVKNTGRCRELLYSGVKVILEESSNTLRKTKYDLVSVYKDNFGLINIDSQAPNKIAFEWLNSLNLDFIKPEYSYGKSRIDFYIENNNQKYLIEVKGCTLEVDHKGYFPDAPTIRGAKHLYELSSAINEGYKTALLYVIQMDGINEVYPNVKTDENYYKAYMHAKEAGVQILYLTCNVNKDAVMYKSILNIGNFF